MINLPRNHWLFNALPFLRWWPMVNRHTLRADSLAALTGAMIVLPQGVAFATIAGLPPEYGLYAAMVPTVIAALFGLLQAMFGDDPVSGSVRFSFGLMEMNSGVELVAIAMGLFGISEIFICASEQVKRQQSVEVKKLLPDKAEWGPTMGAIWRGSVVGFLVGMIPGTNAVIASRILEAASTQARPASEAGESAPEGFRDRGAWFLNTPPHLPSIAICWKIVYENTRSQTVPPDHSRSGRRPAVFLGAA